MMLFFLTVGYEARLVINEPNNFTALTIDRVVTEDDSRSRGCGFEFCHRHNLTPNMTRLILNRLQKTDGRT